MEPTIPIDIEPPVAGTRSSPWSQRDSLLATLAVFIGVVLLLLAGSQLLTELSRIPANSYYKEYQARFLSAENGLGYLRETVKRLERIPPERRGEQEWRRLAAAWLMRPLPEDASEGRTQRNQAIDQAVTATLIRAPVQPLGWAYLADFRLTPGDDCATAMAALSQSYRAAPIEPDFLAYRLALAVRCPMQWTTEFLAALRTDLLAFYAQPPRYVRNRAINSWLAQRPRVQALVRRLLSQQPEVLARFEQQLKRFAR